MEALIYDDFSGSGPLESRNTSYRAEHKWVRGQPGLAWQVGLIVENGGAAMSAADQAARETSDGYILVSSETGELIVLRRPFTIVVEIDAPIFQEGSASVCTGVRTPYGYYDTPFKWYNAVSFSHHYPRYSFGTDDNMPDAQIDSSGYLTPGAAVIGYNRLVVSVDEFGSPAPAVNGQHYGFSPSSVPAETNLAIVVDHSASVKSITVYDGFIVDPPLTPPDPPTPPAVEQAWWKNVANATLEPV